MLNAFLRRFYAPNSSAKVRHSKPRNRPLGLEVMEQRAVLSTTATAALTDTSAQLIHVAPTLPAPVNRVVNVSTEAQLQDAVANLQSNTTIMVAPGVYHLSILLHVHDVSNVSIRGASGNRDDVVLVGQGMTNANYGNVPMGVLLTNAQDVQIADLTIRDVYYHSIALNAGTERPHLYNLRLVNAGEQFVKSNPDDMGGGVDGGIVEYCRVEYTTTAPTDYTNGVDVHAGNGWIIRDNVFKNIRGPQGTLAGPAVLMWRGSSNTLTENNLFLNVQRGIQYGLDGAAPNDHVGGIIRNNFISRSAWQDGDVGIGVYNSPYTKVLHNSVVLSGTYENAIEYRFSGAYGLEVYNNLTDGAIQPRDGASGARSGNLTNAQPEWFVDVASGNLHLSSAATAAINKVAVLPQAATDYDGTLRPVAGAADVGADEYGGGSGTIGTAPTDVALTNNTLPENKPAGTVVGALQTTDATVGDSFTYRLVSGTGSGDNWAFKIVGDKLVTAYSLNYEAKQRYTVRVRTTDASGQYFENALTVHLTDVNDAPQLSLSGSLGYQLNATRIALAPYATVQDVDSPNFAGGKLVVSIPQGADASNRLALGGGFRFVGMDLVSPTGLKVGTLVNSGIGTKNLAVTFNANATPKLVQDLIRSITFRTVSGTSTAARTISFALSDGDGGYSAVRTVTVNVRA